jgi:hypothetical protein
MMVALRSVEVCSGAPRSAPPVRARRAHLRKGGPLAPSPGDGWRTLPWSRDALGGTVSGSVGVMLASHDAHRERKLEGALA